MPLPTVAFTHSTSPCEPRRRRPAASSLSRSAQPVMAHAGPPGASTAAPAQVSLPDSVKLGQGLRERVEVCGAISSSHSAQANSATERPMRPPSLAPFTSIAQQIAGVSPGSSVMASSPSNPAVPTSLPDNVNISPDLVSRIEVAQQTPDSMPIVTSPVSQPGTQADGPSQSTSQKLGPGVAERIQIAEKPGSTRALTPPRHHSSSLMPKTMKIPDEVREMTPENRASVTSEYLNSLNLQPDVRSRIQSIKQKSSNV